MNHSSSIQIIYVDIKIKSSYKKISSQKGWICGAAPYSSLLEAET